jgi:diadenosine tetraphosphate (Ap4A) HIT family hydrolase
MFGQPRVLGMATIFTRIIGGEIPSRMVWEDEQCVAFLDVRPLAPGHCLVVPRAEVDQWTDLDSELAAHLTQVAHVIGNAQKQVFQPARVGLMIAGFEVPHTHVHVIPISSMAQLDFANANTDPDQAALDGHLTALRDALGGSGNPSVSSR